MLILFVIANRSFGQSADIKTFIESYIRDHSFSGTILIKKKDLKLYENSFGLANRAFNVPNSIDTRYKIASVTKIFTSVLILQLYEQGKISLTTPVKTYIPGYTGKGGDKITIHHLLNHTSGLPYVGPKSKEDALDNGMEEFQMPHSIDDAIRKYYSRDPVNEPGKIFSYNNGEYIILGKIIENICGKSFEEVLTQQILKPLGMNNSGLLFQYKIIPNLSDSYFMMNDSIGLVNDLPVFIQNWYSAGAMYSTVSDLDKFSESLFSGKLLKDESLNLMLTPGLENYGYGLWVYYLELNGRKYKVIKRPGDIMGTRAMFVYLPEESLSIIMLANTDSADLDDFSYQLITKLIK
jgi:CubicO group peptidase (beta-lactamase class C family)